MDESWSGNTGIFERCLFDLSFLDCEMNCLESLHLHFTKFYSEKCKKKITASWVLLIIGI